MSRFLAAVVAASCLVGSVAVAQTSTWGRMSFVAVDAVRIDGSSNLLVTGVLEGATESGEEKMTRSGTTFDLAECRKFALIAMSKPGQYKLTFTALQSTTLLYVNDCKLERVAR